MIPAGIVPEPGPFLQPVQPDRRLRTSLPPPATVTASDSAPAHPSAAAERPPSDSLEVIRKFAETYAQRTGTYFCSDPGVTAVVLEGLARHKDELGGALCPCRHYEDKEAEVAQAFWNCPCVPMRERKECHCMLFLTEDNAFRGEKQTISLDEVRALTAG
jgi:ferredoxin-thioredoxin reductase catalytic chain